MRVFALSDIHVDYPDNMQWILALSKADFTDDIIILAGDVSHLSHRLETALAGLVDRFKQVLFVPGNHDLWVNPDGPITSIEKFHQVNTLATDIGASIDPVTVGNLSIIPLLSWYDYSFGQPCDTLKSIWTDYITCRWPDEMQAADITDYFLEKNHQHLNLSSQHVISFSHFLPRIDVMPDYIPASKRILYPVLGTSRLDQQLKRIKPDIHVYGHSHVNRCIDIDGITYINNAFGYPGEQRISAKSLRCIYQQ